MKLIQNLQNNQIKIDKNHVERLENLVVSMEKIEEIKNSVDYGIALSLEQEYKAITDYWLDQLNEKVKAMNTQHKNGVAELNQIKQNILKYSNKHKIIAYANKELVKDSEIKFKGLRKTKTKHLTMNTGWVDLILKHEGFAEIFKLVSDAKIIKWSEKNPELAKGLFDITETIEFK